MSLNTSKCRTTNRDECSGVGSSDSKWYAT